MQERDESDVLPVEPVVVSADQDVVLVLEIVLHVFSVYPNTKAHDFCMVVRSDHFFDAVPGCTSLPDALSHETWVYPSSAAASRCPVAVSVCARLGVSGGSSGINNERTTNQLLFSPIKQASQLQHLQNTLTQKEG